MREGQEQSKQGAQMQDSKLRLDIGLGKQLAVPGTQDVAKGQGDDQKR